MSGRMDLSKALALGQPLQPRVEQPVAPGTPVHLKVATAFFSHGVVIGQANDTTRDYILQVTGGGLTSMRCKRSDFRVPGE